jgi:hypothetical protein
VAISTETVRGLKEARAFFRGLPDLTREVYTDEAIRPTASELVRHARSKLTPGRGFQTGQLQKALGFTVSEKTGSARVGIRRGFESFKPGRTSGTGVHSLIHQPTTIGHHIEFGHGGPHPAKAYPFMVPAADGQRGPLLSRAKAAGRVLEQKAGQQAHIGSRTL